MFAYRKYWAHRFGPAPILPMSRAEMDELGWDSCDIIVVTGDAYVDHPSFGMAIIGRLLADTNSLPEGKLAQVRAACERNAKPFEYAFLLDALKDEQAQGITIDAARATSGAASSPRATL